MNNICPTCQSIISKGDSFCLICGTQTEAAKFHCPQCQSVVENDSQFCENCRSPIDFGMPSFTSSRQFELSPSFMQNTAAISSTNSLPTPVIIGGVMLGFFLILFAAFFLRGNIIDKTDSVQTYTSSNPTTSSTYRQGNSSLIGREGRLATNLNIRSAPNKTASSFGIHFQNAKVKILAVESYNTDDGPANWYKVKVLEYGCDAMGQLGCGKNASNDADEGWINGKYVNLN